MHTYRMQVASGEARALDCMLASCMHMCAVGARLTQSRPCSYLPVVTSMPGIVGFDWHHTA